MITGHIPDRVITTAAPPRMIQHNVHDLMREKHIDLRPGELLNKVRVVSNDPRISVPSGYG